MPVQPSLNRSRQRIPARLRSSRTMRRRPGLGAGLSTRNMRSTMFATNAGYWFCTRSDSTRCGMCCSLRWSLSTKLELSISRYGFRPSGPVLPRVTACAAARPAYIPDAIAKFIPSSQIPAARQRAAASPATSSPGPTSFGSILYPASGMTCAEYSLRSAPSMSGAIAGCFLNDAMISSGRFFWAASLGSFSTTPSDTVSRFV
ncbi:unannotated protein [freshwater metagenome]|uniref:Unannotated protein n=1 Tax=freshwater metagenome TaxID=449393 RepID=A0A6J7E9V5_9ZZZZ